MSDFQQNALFMAISRTVFIVISLFLINGCATYEYHETINTAANRIQEDTNTQIVEEEILDVGIVLFDPGLDLLGDDTAAYSSVRLSEAVWFSSQLKNALDYSNIWGSVRTMPSANSVMDLLIMGKILESNGEVLALQINVRDASGHQWFTKEYKQTASAYAYNPEVNSNRDPFKSVFTEISNDLFDYRSQMTSAELLAVRNISKVRFARDFLPDVYDNFLTEKDNAYLLQRTPASNDPMILRIDQIRARNDLFLDVIQDYYRVFNNKMSNPYQEWRKTSYKEVVYERQLKDQARKEKIAGVAVILAGVLAQTSNNVYTRGAGHVGIFTGADLFRRGYIKQGEALLHTATLRELGSSLETELEPSVVDLQDRSITLSGTVDDQFKEWRRILLEMYKTESGLDADISE